MENNIPQERKYANHLFDEFMKAGEIIASSTRRNIDKAIQDAYTQGYLEERESMFEFHGMAL